MLQGGVKKYMLRVQYRMHPVIRQFPSDTFYGGLITDGNSIKTRQLDPVMTELSKHFRQVVFIDLADSNEKVQDLSKINITEAIFTFYLLKTLLDLSGLRNQGLKAFKNRIAIITPYKG